jgi:hypothetical protein
MKGGRLFTGFCGVLVLATSALADPSLASVERAYRLLRSVAAQLHEVQALLGSRHAAPAAFALATAEEHVHTAFVHCCRALYTAQLRAAKMALAQQDQQGALRYLLKAEETRQQCATLAPLTEDRQQGPSEEQSAFAQR